MIGMLVGSVAVTSCKQQHATSRGHPAPIYERDAEQVNGPPAFLGGPWEHDPAPVANPPGSTYKTIALPGDIGSMNNAALVQYLNSLTYDRSVENGQLALFPCKRLQGNAEVGCNDQDYISAFIQPEVGMRNMSYSDIAALPFGLVVARIVVYDRPGNHIMPAWRIPTHSHAWWLVRKVSGTLRSQIIARNPGGTPAFTVLDEPDTLKFIECTNHAPWADTVPTTARWWSCATSKYNHDMLTQRVEPARPSYFRLAFFGPFPEAPLPLPEDDVALDAAGWIRCGSHCCATL
jgi:hypothetical protein